MSSARFSSSCDQMQSVMAVTQGYSAYERLGAAITIAMFIIAMLPMQPQQQHTSCTMYVCKLITLTQHTSLNVLYHQTQLHLTAPCRKWPAAFDLYGCGSIGICPSASNPPPWDSQNM